jgi:nucleoside-diphosphate-sugar epimerase
VLGLEDRAAHADHCDSETVTVQQGVGLAACWLCESSPVRAIVLGVSGVTGPAIALALAGAGWEVTGTGRDPSRFPASLRAAGVGFERSDRAVPAELAATLAAGADVVVDCVCYTAEHARRLVEQRGTFGSAVVLSSKAVYVDSRGRHSNSDDPPEFDGPVGERQPVLPPDFSGDFESAEGYGPNKVAAEQVLLESGLPVSVLRPSRIHGPGADPPREWFVVRRLLDGRRRIPLARGGRTGNHPTAAANLARLVLTCAEHPGQRVLNAADPGAPTARDVVVAVARACGLEVEPVGLPDDAAPRHGWTPWSTWPPYFLDTSAALGLGYRPAGTYAETVRDTVDALLALSPEVRDRLDRDEYFRGRFDYRRDDAALAVADAG